MRFEITSDIAQGMATASGTAAAVTAIGEVSVQILGVPLPVVLAAFAAACYARSRAPSKGFFMAVGATLGWTLAGCVLAPLGQVAIASYSGWTLPTNATAGLALVISAGLPILMPILEEEVPKILRSWLSRAKAKGGDQ